MNTPKNSGYNKNEGKDFIDAFGKDLKKMVDKIALFILLIGGLNWGLVGLFEFDLVAWLFGGSAAIISRIVYILVALSALWCISLFFKRNEMVHAE